jgi:hypothetical protein
LETETAMSVPNLPRDTITGPDEARLAEAVALSERLILATGPANPAPSRRHPRTWLAGLRRAAGYWLWRLTGRRSTRPGGIGPAPATRRLSQAIAHYEQDFSRARQRIATLEARLAERDRSAELVAEAERRTAEAVARADEADRALAQANSRIEILREALEVTKATAKGGGSVSDAKFREARRAFARLYHPDASADPAKHRLFAEFWPVLEKIDRGG